MALLSVQHSVRDYAAWRAVYDTVGEMQRERGVTAESVHQLANDPNTVLVLHHFASVDQAQAFIADPKLQEVMQSAGVEGMPRFEIYA